jgi:hypothetical protein
MLAGLGRIAAKERCQSLVGIVNGRPTQGRPATFNLAAAAASVTPNWRKQMAAPPIDARSSRDGVPQLLCVNGQIGTALATAPLDKVPLPPACGSASHGEFLGTDQLF